MTHDDEVRARALPDEPTFTLLARDPDFHRLVSEWATQRQHAINCGERPESDQAGVSEAYSIGYAGAKWRKDHLYSWRTPGLMQELRERNAAQQLYRGRAETNPAFAERMALQRAEFATCSVLADRLRDVQSVSPVDDDYPEVRNRYEVALRTFIGVLVANGRLKDGAA